MTLLFRETGDPHGEFELFWSYRQFFSPTYYYGTEILQNMWLFVPFGAILYSLTRKKWIVVVPLLFSFAIELTQLIFGLGLFEFDDIISNSVGGLFGLLIACLLTDFHEGRKKKYEEEFG